MLTEMLKLSAVILLLLLLWWWWYARGLCFTFLSIFLTNVGRSRRLRWARHVARTGKRTGAYKVLVGKIEERRPFEKPTCR
jgi:membrane protein implicated in regulation of membrane protease activity